MILVFGPKVKFLLDLLHTFNLDVVDDDDDPSMEWSLFSLSSVSGANVTCAII